jgi:ABC-type multidrug transport system fused ATPase/permease subunit
VLVLEHGHIAAHGTHDQLLRTSALYVEMYQQQLRGKDEQRTMSNKR